MRLPSGVHYATRALVALANAPAGVPVKCHRIADEAQIPVNFLQLLMHRCQSAGLVQGTRGRCGGFVLTTPAADISVARVWRAVVGAGSDHESASVDSARFGLAALDELLCQLNEAVLNRLDALTIADLAASR
ncbi:MAG: Rrf2 family transcriptional regulator [Frankiaceae bacterium]|nr:Rrf2 family transcriptional regulator [Frankiaceae bacterium]MBV9368878.1 Rrf2 family transcriptional regulator [Frankiales bacterium]